MTPKVPTAALQGVPQTLLGTLFARARETEAGGLICDPRSVEIVGSLSYDFGRLLERSTLYPTSQLAVAVRSEIFDESILLFLRRHPGATVVNLGIGLDTKFVRLDDGLVRWFDLDLPEVIELRRSFFPEGDRYTLLARSVMDRSWLDDVGDPPGEAVLIVAEGLLMYFPEAEVRALFLDLLERFPGAELLFEASSELVVRGFEKSGNPELPGEGALPVWGLDDVREVEAWSPRIRCIKEAPYMHRHEYLWRRILPERYRVGPLRKEWSNCVYHLKLLPAGAEAAEEKQP